MLTPRKRVMNILRGEKTGITPFTIYECFVKPCTAERFLREQGMCIVWRTSSYHIIMKNIEIKRIHYTEKGSDLIRTEYHTPRGLLTRLEQGEVGI
ncbi:MAG: hypothetical protein LBS48_00895 [Treponema sp.]|jgi:hypothetical protein|nr:hypothetical protein [Treponema sp.]